MKTNLLSWVEISKSAFHHNASHYKSILGNSILAAVVKSNAYGHDQLLIAQLCQENPQIGWLCVSNLSEGLLLRSHGISKPILVLSNADEELETAAHQDIAFMCYEKELLEHANVVGVRLGKKLNIHLKIDTGISRFGLVPSEAIEFVQYARSLPFVTIQGIFTHFAQSQHEDPTFTLQQYALFAQVIKELEACGIHIPLRHCANSAAASTLNDTVCNFSRIGIGIYGIWPSESIKQRTQTEYPHFNLRQVATWKTVITGIRDVPASTAVGYDRTFITQRATRIALLPVGYYEGYHRRFSNNGTVIIHDNVAPVIGRICMNVTLVDVSHIPQAIKGDHVSLMADAPGITPCDLATRIQSFNPREVTSRIHGMIKRVLTP